MDEEKKQETKIIILSMAKLRDYCKSQGKCDTCPLFEDPEKETGGCHLARTAPNEWDPDEALYRIAYEEGRRA